MSLYKPVEGRKSFTAVIREAGDGKVTFIFDNGEEAEFGIEDIAKAVRHIDF